MDIIIEFLKTYISNILENVNNKVDFLEFIFDKKTLIHDICFNNTKIHDSAPENTYHEKFEFIDKNNLFVNNKIASANLMANLKIILVKILELKEILKLNIGNPNLVRCII